MEEVYRLFDRRCRTATALAKLAQLRARLRRFVRLREVLKKLFLPGLEKALVFLDEKLLGATSNAVERENRRYRKMQKTVYRVRTKHSIEARLALDLLRERQARSRARDDQDPPQGESRMIQWPGILATVSHFRTVPHPSAGSEIRRHGLWLRRLGRPSRPGLDTRRVEWLSWPARAFAPTFP